MSPRVRIIGPGRAGRAMATALAAHGWEIAGILGRSDPKRSAASDVDVLIIATQDRSVETIAASIEPVAGTLVVHLAGSLGLSVLATHPRRGSLHPLVSIPSPEIGATRLSNQAWYAVDGGTPADRSAVEKVVADLGGRSFPVPDDDRVAYHAAACIAANHLVALMGQVDRIAESMRVPPAAFVALARGVLDGVEATGAAASLTGPVARGDWDTVAGHLAAIDPSERPAYAAMAEAAWRLRDDLDGEGPPAWLIAARKESE